MNANPGSKSLDSQINDYLLNASGHLKESKTYIDGRQVAAFGAAASSALVMMSQAEAAIVHTTPGTAPHVLPTPPWQYDTTGAYDVAPIDLNNDANVDFVLFGYGGTYTDGGTSSAYAGLYGAGSNQVIGGGTYPYQIVNKLASGATIGPSGAWRSGGAAFYSTYTDGSQRHGLGGFGNGSAETGFVGVRFNIGGQTHYGWIRLQFGSGVAELSATEWAYESCPNTPIAAGATTGGATCGVVPTSPKSIPVMGPLAYGLTSLALGGLGLGSLRRRRAVRKAEASRH
jgi:hypothetical protein